MISYVNMKQFTFPVSESWSNRQKGKVTTAAQREGTWTQQPSLKLTSTSLLLSV